MHRSRTRAAALAMVAAVGSTAGCAQEGDSGADDAAVAEAVIIALDVWSVSQDIDFERYSSVIEVMGFGEVGGIDHPTLDEARTATDEAVAGLRPEVATLLGADLPDDMAALRASVDERVASGSASVADTSAMDATLDEYLQLVERFEVDVAEEIRSRMAEGAPRRALEAALATERMARRANELVLRSFPSTAVGGLAPAQVEELTALRAEIETEAEAVRSLDDAPYDAVVAGFPAAEHDAFTAMVDAMLASGTVRLFELIEVGNGARQAYAELRFALVDALQAEVG